MNVNRIVAFETLERRELFSSDLGMHPMAFHHPNHFDDFMVVQRSFAHDVGKSQAPKFEPSSFKNSFQIPLLQPTTRHQRTWEFTPSYDQPNARRGGEKPLAKHYDSSPAEGESNVAVSRPFVEVLPEPPTRLTLIIFNAPSLPVGNQVALTRTPIAAGVADSPNSLQVLQTRNRSNGPSVDLNVSSTPGLNTTTNSASNRAMPESTSVRVRSLDEATSPTIASSSTVRNDSQHPKLQTDSHIAPPSPQGMVDLGSTLLSGLESTGAQSKAHPSSRTDWRRTRVEPNWIDSEVADRVFSLDRLANPSRLPIPADMVFLEFDSLRTVRPPIAEPMMGPFGINPLVLFQTFLHSEPIASASNSESLGNSPTDRPQEVQSSSSLSTTSLGFVAIASAIFFAFSSRNRVTPPPVWLKRPTTPGPTPTST